MSFRHPLSVVAAIAVLITAVMISAVLAVQSAERLRADKRQQILQIRETEQSLIATVNQSLLKSLLHTYEKELATPDSTQALEASEFSAVGSFVQDSAPYWGSDWSITRTPQFSRDWFAELEKTTPLENIKAGELTWLHFVSETGQVQFGLATLVQVKAGELSKDKIVVAVASPGLLDSVSVLSKGVTSQSFVVDREGYTYSYPEAQYVGARIDSHPVVRAMLDGAAGDGVSDFTALDGASISGTYEFVAGSNLAVVVTAPRPSTFQYMTQFFIQTIFVTLGLAALAYIVFGLMLGRHEREKKLLRENLNLVQKSHEGAPGVGVGAKAVVPADGSIHSASNLQTKEVVRGVADYLRTPLTVLLGQLQIAEQQETAPAVKATLTPAINDARRLRDFIESLCGELELTAAQREVVEAVPVVRQVIANYRGLCAKHEIAFENHITSEFALRADAERVRSALSTLFLFAIESLSTATSSSRRLSVALNRLGGVGQVVIEAHGRGLDHEAKKQIFTPFKTRLQQGHLFGLDLVLAQARIEDMQGEILVESLDSESFRITVRFATAISTAQTEDVVVVTSTSIERELPASEAPAISTAEPKPTAEPTTIAASAEPTAESSSAMASAMASVVAGAAAAAEAAAAFDITPSKPVAKNDEERFQIRKPKMRLDL